MILLKDVGDRIRATRNSKQMSQLGLAEKINISASYMSDIEMGKSNFGVDILIRLAEVLQVSLDWLLRADVPESKEIIGKEIEELLSDCSATDAQTLLKMLNDMKKVLHSSKSNND